jgi:hypothetical protein
LLYQGLLKRSGMQLLGGQELALNGEKKKIGLMMTEERGEVAIERER